MKLTKTMDRAVVCLMALALICGVALATPLRSSARDEVTSSCTKHAKELLIALKNVLNRTKGSSPLFYGFNCTELEAVVRVSSPTASVCQPVQDMMCSGQTSSSFSKDECLSSIMADLDYHHSAITAYLKSLDKKQVESNQELRSITASVQSLQQNCHLLKKSGTSNGGRPEISVQSTVSPDTFQARMNMCKELKGFHIRAITINRALGFILTEEMKK